MIEEIVQEIKSSKKYKVLSTVTIRDLVARETGRFASKKNAVKFAKKKLHLILAAYLSELKYAEAARELQAAFSTGGSGAVESACLTIMNKHVSTRERVELLDIFYPEIFKITGEPARIADLACALNPFSFRWMGLPKGAGYYAFDNNEKTVELLNLYLRLEGLIPPAVVRDILCEPPPVFCDVGFLFKMYHCLERRRRGAGRQVVEKAPVQWLAVSFPTRNLANRRADIFANYKGELLELVEQNRWEYEILEFSTEIVLLIRKGDSAGSCSGLIDG